MMTSLLTGSKAEKDMLCGVLQGFLRHLFRLDRCGRGCTACLDYVVACPFCLRFCCECLGRVHVC